MVGNLFARAGLGRSLARFFLLGVLLPNVAFLGHWGVSTADAAHETTHSQTPSGEEHELHCHSGPAKCTGGVATIGSINVNEDSGLITPEGTVKPALDAPAEIAPEAPYIRELKPPQAV
jgi:hypothetical protein